MQRPDFSVENVDIQPAPQDVPSSVLFTIFFRLFGSQRQSSITFILPNTVAVQIG